MFEQQQQQFAANPRFAAWLAALSQSEAEATCHTLPPLLLLIPETVRYHYAFSVHSVSFAGLAKREISRSPLPTPSAILRTHRTGQPARAREREIAAQLEREMLATLISTLLFTSLRHQWIVRGLENEDARRCNETIWTSRDRVRRAQRVRDKGFRKPA